MNCLNNLVRMQIPNDVMMSTLKLYYELGKNEYYSTLFATDREVFSKQVALQDAYYFYKCFFAADKIAEPRLKTLQLDSTVARTKAESLYKNIIGIFSIIHQPTTHPFKLTVTEINDLVRMIFKDYYSIDQMGYQKTDQKKPSLVSVESSSKRELLEKMLILYQENKKKNEYEDLFLSLNGMVDFLNMEIYKFPKNDVIALLIYYILSTQEKLIVGRYVSFFGKLYFHIKEYETVLDKTRFNWKEGYAEIMPMHRLLLKIFYDMYIELGEQARDYEYESKLEISKSDYVENTIDKLNEVFSKEDIRLRHPLISDSTINRTLQRMQADNRIRPLGKGRSAKWIKLYKKETKKIIMEQLNLDLGGK
ncbi:MAG: hypothetical protein PHT27_00545 [Candidatus Izemoplasmatales bacterium]|nr:hypothetical protein [Candidatus Izemoplasmatales bacterium]